MEDAPRKRQTVGQLRISYLRACIHFPYTNHLTRAKCARDEPFFWCLLERLWTSMACSWPGLSWARHSSWVGRNWVTNPKMGCPGTNTCGFSGGLFLTYLDSYPFERLGCTTIVHEKSLVKQGRHVAETKTNVADEAITPVIAQI